MCNNIKKCTSSRCPKATIGACSVPEAAQHCTGKQFANTGSTPKSLHRCCRLYIHNVIVFLPFILAILCVFWFVESGGKIFLRLYILHIGSDNKNLVVEENVCLMKICYKRAITNHLHIEGIFLYRQYLLAESQC